MAASCVNNARSYGWVLSSRLKLGCVVSPFSPPLSRAPLVPALLWQRYHYHRPASSSWHSLYSPHHSIRARTTTRSLKLGSPAPAFQLPEPSTGKIWTLEDFKDASILWVMFLCNRSHSLGYLKPHLVKLAKEYIRKGIGIIAISPNSVKVEPQDGPEQMVAEAAKLKYPFPYLYDETQEVSKAFGPICIPDFFVFKKDEAKLFTLVYHGQIDDSRAINSRPVTYRDIKECLEDLLVGQPVGNIQKPSSGCPVKWHPAK